MPRSADLVDTVFTVAGATQPCANQTFAFVLDGLPHTNIRHVVIVALTAERIAAALRTAPEQIEAPPSAHSAKALLPHRRRGH